MCCRYLLINHYIVWSTAVKTNGKKCYLLHELSKYKCLNILTKKKKKN